MRGKNVRFYILRMSGIGNWKKDFFVRFILGRNLFGLQAPSREADNYTGVFVDESWKILIPDARDIPVPNIGTRQV